MTRQRSRVLIGTSGWGIPSRCKAEFSGSGSHLEMYARRLHTVEINSSFYRHHRRQTYVRWADSVPTAFRFAVKLPRTLTHDGGLTPQPEVLERFIDEVGGLGSRLGVLLVQLPPKLAFDRASAEVFFRALASRTRVPVACEPRHPSWNSPQADMFLTERQVARVAADPPLWPGADRPGGFDQIAYFRWHGQPRRYYSSYENQCLTIFRERAESAALRARHTWAFFDNTAHGYALENALAMTSDMVADPRAVIRHDREHDGSRVVNPLPSVCNHYMKEIAMAARKPTSKARTARRLDAITLLKNDHRQVEEWFEQFEKARSPDKKAKLATQICTALTVHAQIEEEIFYPAFLELTEDEDMHHEAVVEHDGAKNLIAQIESMSPSDDYFDAKVKVLSEMIKHHVKEEEQREGMFAEAKSSGMDLEAVGEQLAARKAELMGEAESAGSRKSSRKEGTRAAA